MSVLQSTVDPSRESFQANARHHRGLAYELRDRCATLALGGSQATRDRHIARGKLLPRERVKRLLDPGSPFLEIGALAAYGMYDGEAPGAGVIGGIGRVSRP